MIVLICTRMFLKPPAWARDFLDSASSTASSAPQGSVAKLVISLTNHRQYREVLFALRTGLRDARSEFSFLRVEGLKKLASLLASVAKSEALAQLFRLSQAQPDFQVVPVLFEHTLSPPKLTIVIPPDPLSRTEPSPILMPPTIGEIIFALRVLEGCCLLDASSRTLASQHMGVKEILELLWVGGVPERLACLDALLPLLLDSPTNQKELDRLHGIRKIIDLMQNKHVDKKLRLKSAEFLLLFVGQILPSSSYLHGDGRKLSAALENIQVDLAESLGEDCAFALDALVKNLISSDVEAQLQPTAQKLLDLTHGKYPSF